MNNDVYCALPWMQLMIAPSGDYKVCCFSGDHEVGSHGFCLDETGKPMNVLTHSMQQAIRSKTNSSIQLAQMQGVKHKECTVCWVREAAAGKVSEPKNTSIRINRTFHQFPAAGIDTDPGPLMFSSAPLKIRSLDLRFTNTCNLKCVMCSPLYSSAWYEDWNEIHGDSFGDAHVKYKIININGVYKSDMPRWHDTDIWKQRFDEVKADLRHIYMTGGEPFLVKGHADILDDLIANDLAKNIHLQYDTNLTVMNQKILDKLAHFKKVVLNVSFDDVGERYEYIRHPGSFQQLMQNIELLNTRKTPNIEIGHISSCLGILNIYAPFRFNQLLRENDLGTKDHYRILRAPDHFDPKYLPSALKEKVLAKYADAEFDHSHSLIVNYLKNSMNDDDVLCVKKTREHVIYLDTLDRIRGLDWKKAFPETADLLKKFIA